MQQAFGGLVAAHERARGRHAGDEFKQEIFDDVGFDRADARHGDRELAQLVVVEHAPDLGAILFAERKHQHGRARAPGERALAGGGRAAGERGHRSGEVALGFGRVLFRGVRHIQAIKLRWVHSSIGG